MSILLLERAGLLGQAAEATLRLNLNRGNRWWWRNAAAVPLADWPAYRDGQIKAIFDQLEWLPMWELPDGEYVVRQGMGQTVAVKSGDVIRFYDLSARQRRYDLEKVWRPGEPCPYAYSEAEIAALWDERVNEARLYELHVCAPDDCVVTWPPRAQEAVREVLALARQERWEDALAVAEPFDYELFGVLDYLRTLCKRG